MCPFAACCAAAAALSALGSGLPAPAEFMSPGAEHRPETWFHVIGGNASKAGLTADLEAAASEILGILAAHREVMA